MFNYSYLFVFKFKTFFTLFEAFLDKSVKPLTDALEHHQAHWNAAKCKDHAKHFSKWSVLFEKK